MSSNVLLVVLDTVRAKSCIHHGRERDTTTGLSNLRSEAITFSRAIAPATWTVPSHAAMFTGKYASQIGVHPKNKILPSDEETIATSLSKDGYSTALLTSNPFLTEGTQLNRGMDFTHTSGMRRTIFEDAFDPAAYIKRRNHEEGVQKILELAQELASPPKKLGKNIINAAYYKYRTTWKPSSDESKFDPSTDDGAKETISRFSEWLEENRQPFFGCLNFMEAHSPYRHRRDYLPDWADTDDLEELVQDRDAYFEGDVELSERSNELLTALYEAEIKYLDRQLSRLWTVLREEELWEDTLVVVTSDHGEYLGEHDLLFHHHNRLSDPLIHVPLLVKYPGGKDGGQTVSAPVDLTQIYDTIMSVTGESESTECLNPLQPGVSPEMVKSEYICKEPDHSTEDYLEKYKHINTPSRAVIRDNKKYIIFEKSERAYIKKGVKDEGDLTEFKQVDLRDVPEDVVKFGEFENSFQRQELHLTNSVEDRLENLGYK